LRLKALAILYYLALENSADRQELASLFWDNADPQTNLRVELHHLRGVLRSCGVDAFARHQNPLTLPTQIRLDQQRRDEQPLEGLERITGVSAAFEVWLEWHKRTLLEPTGARNDREALLDELTLKLPRTGVLILQGLPGSDRTAFAQSLARRLNLSFTHGFVGGDTVMKYHKAPFPGDLRQQVLTAKGLVVLSRSAFGETPRGLLEIAEALPPERVAHLSLPPLTWMEARQGVLAKMRFGPAAKLYTASQGVPALLRELLQQEDHQHPLGAGQLKGPPPKTLAKLQLELRYLPMDARIALEKLVVHPGSIPEPLAATLDAEAHLEEFERRGWLTYRRVWRFTHEAVRRILHEGLQPGRRARTHQRVAAFFAQTEDRVAETYHRLHAGDAVDWLAFGRNLDFSSQLALCDWLQQELLLRDADAILEQLPPRTEPPRCLLTHSGRELALLEAMRYGEGIHEHDTQLLVTRTAGHAERCGIVFVPLEEAALVRVRGRALIDNTFGFGLEPHAAPLEFSLYRAARTVRLQHAEHPAQLESTTLLPAGEQFEYWLHLPADQPLHVSSGMERGVFELQLEAYALTAEGQRVEAFTL
jgi:hypothetical protein